MKRPRTLMITGAVIGGLITLVVLAANGASSPTPTRPVAASGTKACDCENLEALQIELRNAVRLQQAFRSKIADLRAMDQKDAQGEFNKFAKSLPSRFIRPKGDTGPEVVEYTPYGNGVDTGILDKETETKERHEQLCEPSREAKQEIEDMRSGAVCAGIVKAVVAHEEIHWASCRRLGYVPFRNMPAADRAQEEVDAYGAQIKTLREEIARVLEGATLRIVTESSTRLQMPPNPIYTAIILGNQGEVLMSRAPGSRDTIRFEGKGQQTTTGKVEGNCSFAGVPFTMPTRGSIETDGLDALIRYAVDGTQPSVRMQCSLGPGTGSGRSMPAPMNNSSNVPSDTTLPLRDGADIVVDLAKGQAAEIMSKGGAQVSGQTKMTLFVECKKQN
jgi:hypothetical protein